MINRWLALDVGTTGTKAALLDADGRALRSATRGYPTRTDEGGRVEQDADDWWRAACEAVRDLGADEAEAIAITGQMQDVIVLDADGRPLRPAILYSDTRAHAEADAINAWYGAGDLTALTGNEQGPSGVQAKLRWLSTHEPEVMARARHVLLGAGDVVAFRLTGVAACDTTNAATTGLMHLDTRAWLFERVGSLGNPPPNLTAAPLLPALMTGGAQIGAVHAAGAAALGVRAGIPVHLGPGDAGAATLGAGSGVPGRPYAYIGTSGWVAYTAHMRGSPAEGVFTLAHPAADSSICVAPLLTAGGNLDWVRGVLGGEDVSALIDAALARPVGSLLYLPYLNGERSPINDPLARGAFIGLSGAHARDDLARAVLEGVAFAYKHALDALVTVPVARLLLTGGGARSQGWAQMLADITGETVAVVADAANVGVRGAVLAAQVMRGERASYDSQPDVESLLTPDPDRVRAYARKYVLFREAYRALRPVFAGMA